MRLLFPELVVVLVVVLGTLMGCVHSKALTTDTASAGIMGKQKKTTHEKALEKDNSSKM